MPQRKGQFIVNHLRFTLKIPEPNIGRYLFNMLDEEFEEIAHTYRKYAIQEIHKTPEQKKEEFDTLVTKQVDELNKYVSKTS